MTTLHPLLLLAVFVGGGLGSVLRYLFGAWLNDRGALPWGTLAANLAATALLAWVVTRCADRWPDQQALQAGLAIGLCGGFSTFSTFSADTQRLMAEGQWAWALANVAVSVIGCIAIFAYVSGLMRR